MIFKSNRLLYGAFLLCLPSLISANITTMQSWDPNPVFNATNLNTPPDTQFCTLIKRQIIDDLKTKRRKFGINFSPFIQRAIRAQTGPDTYYGDYSTGFDSGGLALAKPAGREMSDYQGTPFLMGLFLGPDENGNSIWLNNTDTGNTVNITTATVDATSLAVNSKSAIKALNNTAGTSPNDAIIYNIATNSTFTSPSILSESVLELDQIYFGAISIPLTYQKTGLRWEANFDINDNLGFIFQGGAGQITQQAGRPITLTTVSTTLSSSPIYQKLNTVANASATTPVAVPITEAQASVNEWVSNNVEDLLDPDNGANYDIDTYSASGFEDLRFLLFARHTFPMQPKGSDADDYYPMLITPYAIIGYTVPISPVRDYSLVYSLPFGNNGHQSFGGVAGLTFDFISSVEIGFEGGATFFLGREIDNVPCPNHQLQRVFYPYRRDLDFKPGFNWHFGATLNAIEFIKNVSFLFTYDFVQHTRDSITQVAGQTGSQYFYPDMLEDLSPWTSQMFTAALNFKIQPGIYVSLAWQEPLSQINAYCSNTILGSLSFLF